MQDLLPVALPLFFSNNNRERLFVTSRPSYLQMRASSQKCTMQPPVLQMQQHTMAAQAFLRARNRYFIHPSSISEALFSPCVGVCTRAGIYSQSSPPPEAELIHLCSGKAGTNAHIQPSQLSPSLSHTHAHTFCLCKHTDRSVFPHHPLPTRQGPSSPAPHSPIWILLGKLAPNTAPRKLVQKKAKMCCIFPFALAKKKPSSKHRFDFSPALLSLAASPASPALRLRDARLPRSGSSAETAAEQRLAAGLTEPREKEREPAPHPHPSPATHNAHAHAHAGRFHPAPSPAPSWSSAAGYRIPPGPGSAPGGPASGL